ncbi:hypothetical protein [Candidatus Pantoea deserta]|uniref:hypothetical protein n=1 Tax=Candidatus Pantoea deserta TaxID=1869313 RepID=UPI000F500637|nr:hypothetical protein [Pantoea deserta]
MTDRIRFKTVNIRLCLISASLLISVKGFAAGLDTLRPGNNNIGVENRSVRIDSGPEFNSNTGQSVACRRTELEQERALLEVQASGAVDVNVRPVFYLRKEVIDKEIERLR